MFKFLTEIVPQSPSKAKAPKSINWDELEKLAVGKIKMRTDLRAGPQARASVAKALATPDVRRVLEDLARRGMDEMALAERLAKVVTG